MAISTLQTPNTNIYDPYPPEVYQSAFDSPWTCAHLPVVYKLLSTLFPINNADTPISISSHADNGIGLVEFTTSSPHGLNKFDYGTIASASIAAYNGTFEIIEVNSTTEFTINVAYDSSSLGSPTVVRYYNNYHAKIEFYQGLDSGHTYYNQDPESLKATVRVLFDSNNEAFVDLSKLSQAFVNSNNSNLIPSFPNQLNLWTQVRIKIWEAYDDSDGTTVSVVESDQGFEDYIYLVNAKKVFRSRYGPNIGDYVLNSVTEDTKFLTPRSNALLFEGYYYDISILIENAATYTLVINEKNAAGAIVNVVTEENIISDIGLFRFRLDNLITSVAKCVDVFLSVGVSDGVSSFTWSNNTDVPLATFIGWDCLVDDSGNFYFVGRDDNLTEAKVYKSTDEGLTWSLKLTGGVYTFTCIDQEGDDVVVATSGATDTYHSSNGGDSFSLMANNSGIAFDIVTIGGVTYKCINVGTNGIFKTADFGATAWTNISIGVGGGHLLKRMFFRSTTLGWVVGGTGRIYKTTDGSTWADQTTGTDSLEGIYMISDTVGIICGQGGVILKTTNGGTNWNTVSSGTVEDLFDVKFLTALVGYIVGRNGTILRTEDAGDTWAQDTSASGSDFSALDSNTGASEALMLTSSSTVDSQKLVAVLKQQPTTETKTICIKRDCSNQQIYLTWLNNLGGWEYHLFTAEKEFLTDIEESVNGDRSLYNNWPTSYITGETVREWLRVKGRDGMLVRSQFLTQAQADEVARIQQSIHVQWMMDGMDDKVTVLVDKGSFRRYNETDKLQTIEFRILMTNEIAVQSN